MSLPDTRLSSVLILILSLSFLIRSRITPKNLQHVFHTFHDVHEQQRALFTKALWMLAAAQSPPVVLLPQQTRLVPEQRKQLDAYNGSASTIVPSAAASPVSVSISLPMPVSVPVPMPVQSAIPVPMPLPVQQRVEGPSLVPPQERLLAAQLAHLASQHHASEYSRFKHGQKGAPVTYVPLSLHAPAQVRELRVKQACNAEQRAWWISNGARCGRPEKPFLSVAQEEEISPALTTRSSLDISEEISAAMSSQMITRHITKTSQSHPINISMVIPSEALPGIVSRFVEATNPTPIMFHLPEDYYLNHLTAISAHNPFYRSENLSYSSFARPPVPVRWVERGSGELENALKAEFTLLPPRPFVPSQERRCIRSPPKLPLWKLPTQVPTLPSPSRGVVRRRQRNGRAKSAPPAFPTQFKGVQRRVSKQKDLRLCFQGNSSSPEARKRRLDDSSTPLPSFPRIMDSAKHREDGILNNATGKVLMLPPASVTASLNPSAAIGDATSPGDTIFTHRLGNLYLSSCPGKKVRLSGPIKGRSAICRDLRADLTRIKGLGVGCVICCLDDSELEFLGASWTDYSSVANELGLDVLRIPMPEGLGPLSPAALDVHLKCIIESYTLRGVPVLAHCRGGVGRAGLLACCWMLKLGLCGWKDQRICKHSCGEHATCNQSASNVFDLQTGHTRECSEAYTPMIPPSQRGQTQNSATGFMSVPRVCRATLSLVERVLAVVRRRRSLKAVETYEQVRFLVEFIEYLEAKARRSVEISNC